MIGSFLYHRKVLRTSYDIKNTACLLCAARGDEVCCVATPLARGECALHILCFKILFAFIAYLC